MKTIDGQIFKQMVISGANNLYNSYPEVDALNVFPVPDGDTGMNMNLTMTSGAKEISSRNDNDIYQIARAFSKGLLMGARGNSGVITSQIFRGIAEGMIDKKEVNVNELAEAFENGYKVAYKGVIKPVEGTILTVIREAATALAQKVNSSNINSIEKAMKVLREEAHASLERTPNLLPVLKEVGVVDSGGAGLCKIIDGMDEALNGNFIDRNEATVLDSSISQTQTQFDEEEFGYCTEFIMRLGPNDVKKAFNKNRFTNVLNSHGNSLVVVQDEDIVKVHVHTLRPGDIFNYAQQFGEFVKLKCENMTEQHHEILFNEENGGNHMAASDLKKAPLAAPRLDDKKKEKVKFSLIATSSGKGIDELFNEIGVNEIVSGGQTMNPSTNDFLTAIEHSNAENVFIFPNNGNIIMAANQARDVLEGKVNVVVIPSKTIMQGVVSAMNFNSEMSLEDNKEVMEDALNSVKSGAVTFAIKDTEINGVSVKKDDFMAIKETKDIISCHKNKEDALFALLEHMIDEDSSVVTVLCGNDIDDETLKVIKEKFESIYNFVDLDLRKGDQPVYSFIVGVE